MLKLTSPIHANIYYIIPQKMITLFTPQELIKLRFHYFIKQIIREYSRKPTIQITKHKLTTMEEVRKGYVPMLVGKEEEKKKIWVPIRVIQHPTIVELLDQYADEYGYGYQQGLLRISCDAPIFRSVIHRISKK